MIEESFSDRLKIITDKKDNRLKSLVLKSAAEFIERESSRSSLITVTNIIIQDKGKGAIIFFSVLPEHKEQAVLDFLLRQRRAFKEFMHTKIKGCRISKVDFKVDLGEKNRQRVEEALSASQ